MHPCHFDHLEIRPTDRRLLIDGHSAPLGARAFDVLLALVERRDRTVTKNELIDLVWRGLVVEENNLQVQISTLRKVLGQEAISTIPGQGYRFTLPAEEAEACDPAYRDRLIEGLRKAGVPEGAGTDIPLDKVRRLLHKNGEGYYDVAGATTIDHKHAKTLHDRGVKFVDVRPAKDFATGHVPRAFNLDIATELSRESLARIVGKNEEFALSCHGKNCPDSACASAKAVMWGFKRVYYFAEGFPVWQETGYPVEVSRTN